MTNRKYDVSFSMVNEEEFSLIVNAIKRQVDYYRNKLFSSENTLNDYALGKVKHNYKIYCDLYSKIITDYNDVVKLDA